MTTDTPALVAALRARRTRRAAPVPSDPAGAPHAFDFATLPETAELRLQRAAGDVLGCGNPFFRAIGDAGVRAVVDGRPALNFASYDYLGLGTDPRVREAAAEAAWRWGVSAGASRLVGGERPWHATLEAALARFLGAEAAVAMVSGHATNVTTIATLLGPGDLILTDALVHNSVVEGARLSGAARLTYPHDETDWIDATLRRRRHEFRRVLIVTEGLYSMDGDAPGLAALVTIKNRHDAWLMVDEAHSLGVLGPTGRGITEAQGVDPAAVEIRMGTLSKTLASCGGFVAGSTALIELLKYRAAGFVFSVGLPAPSAAAAETALSVLAAEPERVARLAANGRRFLDRAHAAGLDTGHGQGHAIAPVIVGDSARAVAASRALLDAGVHALPILFPAVPERLARLRFFLSAMHEDAMIDVAVAATARALAGEGRRAAS